MMAHDIGSDPEAALNERLKKWFDRQSALSAKLEDMYIEAMAIIAEMRYIETLITECMDEKRRMRVDQMNQKLALADKMAGPSRK